jgi:hypothetical protein
LARWEENAVVRFMVGVGVVLALALAGGALYADPSKGRAVLVVLAALGASGLLWRVV